MEIGTAFVTIRPETSGFEAELAAAVSPTPVDVPVTADVSDAESAVADITGDDVEVGVDADTTAAEAAIDSIPDGEAEVVVSTDQAEEALAAVREQIDQTAGSTGQLGEVAQGALGGMGSLGGAAGGAAGALGGAAVAGGAAAAGLFTFAQAGLEAAGAAQRFDMIAGPMADRLSTIDVGGLSGDIGELALQLGSSDEAMFNATSSFVTFAQSTGASNDEIVATSNNINALALRAVALNPGLGDAGAVAERLSAALARGGRATTAFGIGLTSAEINARALANTGKQNAADLTQMEKAAAGAAIAVERLGGTMGSDFAAGSQNAQTQWNRMTESIGEAVEAIGTTTLPAVENITEAVTELADGIANLDFGSLMEGLWDISAPGLVANGLTDLWSAISVGSSEVEGQGRLVGDLAGSYTSAADAAETYAASQQAAADAVAGTVPALGDIISTADRAGEAFGVLNASSDPQVIIDNLRAALSAWDDFQANIQTIAAWGPNIAAALQQLGPEVAGGLTNALATGGIGMIAELDGLVQQVAARGGDVSAVLTGFAQGGMAGAQAVVAGAAPGMATAGTQAGAAAAAGIDAGLATSQAGAAGMIAGTNFAISVATGITSMTGTVSGLAGASMAAAAATAATTASAGGRGAGILFGAGAVGGIASMLGTMTGIASSAGTVTGSVFGAAAANTAGAGARAAMAVAAGGIAGGAPYGLASSVGFSVGTLIGSGIAGGIRSTVGSIASAAAAAVNQAEAAARAAADSNSPSRVFMAVGKDLGDGLKLGFEAAAAGLATSAAGQITSAANANASVAGFDLDRGTSTQITGGGTRTFQVAIDGAVVAEKVFEWDRRIAYAEGFEQ